MATTHRLTVADLTALPSDGERYELLDGVVYQVNPPSTKHLRIVLALASWLYRAQRAGYGRGFVAPIGVILSDQSKVEPDALFIRTGREAIITEPAIVGSPDLIIEVISPTSRARDTAIKYQLYARAGVPHYWLIDPDTETVTGYELAGTGEYRVSAEWGSGDRLSSPLFPAITLEVEELFHA